MKHKNIKINFLCLSITVLCISLFSCKKKNDDVNASSNTSNGSTPKGTLMLHLHNYIDNVEVDDYNIVYTTSTDGRKISLSKGQFYLSNIELIKLDGSVYSIPDSIVLKLQEIETYTVADVPVGNYKSVRFYVGLNPTVNQKTPSSSVSDVLNKSDMWYGSTAQPQGYVYMNISGKIDTTSSATGTVANMQPFKYLIGTNANYKQITMPDQNYSITPNQVQYIHLLADYSKLFSGIQLNNNNNLTLLTPADNAGLLGIKLGNNMSTIFSYEE